MPTHRDANRSDRTLVGAKGKVASALVRIMPLLPGRVTISWLPQINSHRVEAIRGFYDANLPGDRTGLCPVERILCTC